MMTLDLVAEEWALRTGAQACAVQGCPRPAAVLITLVGWTQPPPMATLCPRHAGILAGSWMSAVDTPWRALGASGQDEGGKECGR